MTSQRQYISKGFYERSQISDLVSVKEYIVVRHNEKKCLMLRFFNVQMDAAGKILETTKVKYTDLNFMPSTTYVDPTMIAVNEYCSDFRIVFTEIMSGRYKYTVRHGKVTVDYIKAEEPIIKSGKMTSPITAFSVKPRRFGKPRTVAFLTALVAFLLVVMCAFDVFFNYDFNGKGGGEKTEGIESDAATNDNRVEYS